MTYARIAAALLALALLPGIAVAGDEPADPELTMKGQIEALKAQAAEMEAQIEKQAAEGQDLDAAVKKLELLRTHIRRLEAMHQLVEKSRAGQASPETMKRILELVRKGAPADLELNTADGKKIRLLFRAEGTEPETRRLMLVEPGVLEGRLEARIVGEDGEARVYELNMQAPRAFLGIHMGEGDDGVKIVKTVEGSPAAAAKLRPGDRIVAVNGKPVAKVGQLVELMREQKPGDVVELLVLRGEQTKVLVKVTLGKAPAPGPAAVRRAAPTPLAVRRHVPAAPRLGYTEVLPPQQHLLIPLQSPLHAELAKLRQMAQQALAAGHYDKAAGLAKKAAEVARKIAEQQRAFPWPALMQHGQAIERRLVGLEKRLIDVEARLARIEALLVKLTK
jgi:hypothetical protein